MDFTGYKKYKGSEMHKGCDEYYAKCISDEIGKRYQIVFYEYDWSKYPQFKGRNPISWMPEIYYRLNDDVSVYHTFAGFNNSIEYVEKYADEMWQALNKPYLEKYEGG